MADFDEEKQNKQLDEIHKEEEEQLVEVLARSKYGLPYANLHRLGIDNEALRSISEADARELKIAPFKLSGKNIFIAVRSPSPELMERVKQDMERQSLVPTFYMTSMASLEKVWERYLELSMAENAMQGGLEISGDTLRNTAKEIRHMQDIERLMKEAKADTKIHKVSRILEIILAGAIAIKASDIHIEREKNDARLRLRLDGVLQDVDFFEVDLYNLLNSRINFSLG
jgi:type IV pilus assembly protein PilB